MMSKGGRPMLRDVVRFACGKINKKAQAEAERKALQTNPDAAPPSPRVKAERDLFSAKCFKGGGLGQHAGDAIGQLWLVGRLDVPGYDETKLLDAARAWWNGRLVVFKDVQGKTGRFERASRTSNASTKPGKDEKAFYRYEAMLRDAADFDYQCLGDLMQERGGEKSYWAMRIVQDGITQRLVGEGFVTIANGNDRRMLDGAKRALVIMAGDEAAMSRAA